MISFSLMAYGLSAASVRRSVPPSPFPHHRPSPIRPSRVELDSPVPRWLTSWGCRLGDLLDLTGHAGRSKEHQHDEDHQVRVYRSDESLPREEQLAWRIAEVATDPSTDHSGCCRDDRQPDHRQHGGGGGVAPTEASGECSGSGSRSPDFPRCGRLRVASCVAVLTRVGCMGQRCGSAGARFS